MTDPQPTPQQIALQNVTANVIRIGSITQTIHYTQRTKALSSVVNEGLPPLPKDELWQTRQQETQLRQWLAIQKLRVIGLEGAGGYGKSATAAKVVQTLATSSDSGFKRQPLWVNFQEPIAFGTFARWVIRTLVGEVAYDQRREAYEQLDDAALVQESLNHLTQHPCVLVMDNLETLFQGEALWQPYGEFLDGWLGRSGGGCLLLTSQYRLELPSANAWTWLPLRGLDQAQGVALLQGEGVIGKQADLEAYVEAADGHPLLLTLAVNLLKRQEKEDFEQPEILRLGRSGVELLRGIVESHRGDSEASVGKVLDASFERLYPAWLRVLLWRLSVVRQGFGLEMAQVMVDEAVELQQLRYLARWSFVQEAKLDGEWRFDFLPLIARYLQLGAEEQAQTTVAHEQAIAFYTRHAQPWDGTLASCHAELEVFHHACELGNYTQAYDALGRSYDVLYRRGYYQELLPLCQRLALEWQPKDIAEQAAWSTATTSLGNLHRSLGKPLQAIDCHQKSLDIARKIGNRQIEATCLNNLSSSYYLLGQFQQTIELLQQSLKIDHETGNRSGEATVLDNLGSAYANLGQFQQAIEFHQQSLEIKREIDDSEGGVLCNLGNAYEHLGQYQQAIVFYKQALAIQREVGNRSFEAASLMGLGTAYNSQGLYPRAIEFFQQSLDIVREVDELDGEANSLNGLGTAYHCLGQYPQAIKLHQQSLEIYCEIGNRNGEAGSLDMLANTYCSLKQYQQAIELHQQSLEIRREIGDCDGEANSLCNLGNVYSSLRQFQQAIELYQQSLDISRDIGSPHGEAACLGNLGAAYEALQQYPRAIKFHQQSLAIQQEIGDQTGEARSLFNVALVLCKMGEHGQALLDFQQAKSIFVSLHLDHEIERCDELIRTCHQIIPTQRRLAPSIGDDPKLESLSDWYERERQANQRKPHPAQTHAGSQPFYLWGAVALVVTTLVWWLKN